jgi:hypothetical protein
MTPTFWGLTENRRRTRGTLAHDRIVQQLKPSTSELLCFGRATLHRRSPQ